VAAALAIIDEDGLDALSMRRLGRRLDVDPMAVYYHLPNKAAVYDAIMDEVVGALADLDLPTEVDLESFVVNAGKAYWDLLLAHPRALPLVTARPLRTEHTLAVAEMLLTRFEDAGLTPEEGIAAVNAFGHLVEGAVNGYAQFVAGGEVVDEATAGFASARLDPVRFPRLSRAAGEVEFRRFAWEFEFALRVMARGFEATARRRGGGVA
jgi:AcrR family transcriptional regulator